MNSGVVRTSNYFHFFVPGGSVDPTAVRLNPADEGGHFGFVDL